MARKQCAPDRMRHIRYGMMVFVVSILAVFSGRYAYNTVFPHPFQAFIFGLAWGTTVAIIDMMLLATMRKSDKPTVLESLINTLGVALRILFAIGIAAVVTKPLELRIMEKEINTALERVKQSKLSAMQDTLDARYASMNVLSNSVHQNSEQLNKLQDRIDSAFAEAYGEADGTRGSRIPIPGSRYREKLERAQEIQRESRVLMDTLRAQITRDRARLDTLSAEKRAEFRRYADVQEEERTFLARYLALNQVKRENPGADRIGWGLIAALTIFEVLAIFAKAVTKPGPYDKALAALEKRAFLREDLRAAEFEKRERMRSDARSNSNELVDEELAGRLEEQLRSAMEDPRMEEFQSKLRDEILARLQNRQWQDLDATLAHDGRKTRQPKQEEKEYKRSTIGRMRRWIRL